MLNRSILQLILALAFCEVTAQVNLVPNPSFEIHDTCPNNAGQINHAVPWFTPTTGTPDLYDTCAPAPPISFVNIPYTQVGYSYAHSGNSMAGIDLMDGLGFCGVCNIYREYLMVKLQSNLVNNQKYYLTYYVKLADSSSYASNKISVLFSDTIYKNTDDTINRLPQITTQNFVTSKTTWTKIKGSYIANGTEKFMCIGNFRHPITNDTLFLGGSRNYTGYEIPYYFVDDICLSTDSLFCDGLFDFVTPTNQTEFKIYPNPTHNILFIEGRQDCLEFKLFNLYGSEIHIKKYSNYLDISNLENGVYFLKFITRKSQLISYKIIKQ